MAKRKVRTQKTVVCSSGKSNKQLIKQIELDKLDAKIISKKKVIQAAKANFFSSKIIKLKEDQLAKLIEDRSLLARS